LISNSTLVASIISVFPNLLITPFPTLSVKTAICMDVMGENTTLYAYAERFGMAKLLLNVVTVVSIFMQLVLLYEQSILTALNHFIAISI